MDVEIAKASTEGLVLRRSNRLIGEEEDVVGGDKLELGK